MVDLSVKIGNITLQQQAKLLSVTVDVARFRAVPANVAPGPHSLKA